MGYLRRPAYYKDFKCISSACTDSCCTDWEIDVDQDTLDYYMHVEGEFGEELKKKIYIPGEDEDALPHFIQTKNERCPFLNDCNLCEVFIHLGEEHLSQICTHHPRFYDWFLEGEEAGLGLCCEEAARLVLTSGGKADFNLLFTDDEEVEEDMEDAKFELLVENTLFKMRDELFELIGKPDQDSKENLFLDMDHLYNIAYTMQDRLDDLMFPGDDYEAGQEELSSFTERFFEEENLEKLLSFYEKLEINDMNWWKLLKELKKNGKDILNEMDAFLAAHGDYLTEYRNLLIYFIYRHFMKAREDNQVKERIAFVLNSICMIIVISVYEWMRKGELSLKDRIDVCKLYSKEIEYSEENVDSLLSFCI